MMHLLFLLGSLVTTALLQIALLSLLSCQRRWQEERHVLLAALALPGVTALLFSLLMVPDILMDEASLLHSWEHALVWATALLPAILWAGTLVWNLLRLLWLVVYVNRSTWEAPPELSGRSASLRVSLRLWYHPRPFAFTLPTLWPRRSARVIVSTALVACLDTEEVQAVLWHEAGHVRRHDFWSTWLATWWRDAFFYLPWSWKLLRMLKEGQERSCDAWVATTGGKQVALALASALLKVWDGVLQTEGMPTPPIQHTPGLAFEKQISMLEQRVQWLLEHIQGRECTWHEEHRSVHWVRTGVLVGATVTWLSVLASLHFFLFSLGCAL